MQRNPQFLQWVLFKWWPIHHNYYPAVSIINFVDNCWTKRKLARRVAWYMVRDEWLVEYFGWLIKQPHLLIRFLQINFTIIQNLLCCAVATVFIFIFLFKCIWSIHLLQESLARSSHTFIQITNTVFIANTKSVSQNLLKIWFALHNIAVYLYLLFWCCYALFGCYWELDNNTKY